VRQSYVVASNRPNGPEIAPDVTTRRCDNGSLLVTATDTWTTAASFEYTEISSHAEAIDDSLAHDKFVALDGLPGAQRFEANTDDIRRSSYRHAQPHSVRGAAQARRIDACCRRSSRDCRRRHPS
jgi:hypothetical protein